MPKVAYVCEVEAVPSGAVVSVTAVEPSPKLMLIVWPPRGVEFCRRRRPEGCPLKIAAVSVMLKITGSANVLVLADAKFTVVGVRYIATHIWGQHAQHTFFCHLACAESDCLTRGSAGRVAAHLATMNRLIVESPCVLLKIQV